MEKEKEKEKRKKETTKELPSARDGLNKNKG